MTRKWTVDHMPSQAGKVAIVTGANSGLGLQTAAGLAAAGATVIMACRDTGRGRVALAEVQRRAPRSTVELMTLDLASLASVRAFAEAFSGRYLRLDLLINNAGVMAVPLSRTREGFEMQIGTNHLGHFALTSLLLPRLRTTGGARVVNVASLAHRWTRGIDFDDLNWERKPYTRWAKWDAYGKSKLANLMFTFELARRLKDAASGVIAAAAHPGYSATNLQFVGPALEKSAIGRFGMKFGNMLLAQPAEMGALPTLYAATAPDVANGDYIGPGGFRQLHGYPVKVGCRRDARNPEPGARLWALSESLTEVRFGLR